MSCFQFLAATGGFAKANAPPDDQSALTPSEVDALSALIDEPPVWH